MYVGEMYLGEMYGGEVYWGEIHRSHKVQSSSFGSKLKQNHLLNNRKPKQKTFNGVYDNIHTTKQRTVRATFSKSVLR